MSANVFTAVIVGENVVPADERTPVRSTFRITETFKGRPLFPAFVSNRFDVICGIDLEVSVEYLFFAADSGALGLCSGTVRRDAAQPQLAALRAFASGEHLDLAEPWRYEEFESGCSLTTSFDLGEDRAPGDLEISASRQRAAENPQFDIAELSIRMGGGTQAESGENRDALRLAVNDTAYTAVWTAGRVVRLPSELVQSLDVTLPPFEFPGSYLLGGESVEQLLRELTTSDALIVRYDGSPLGLNPPIEVRTTNLGDGGIKMLECVQRQQAQ